MAQLSRKVVQNIHLEGGSLLGVSRGGARTTDIVDSIQVSVFVSVWFTVLRTSLEDKQKVDQHQNIK